MPCHKIICVLENAGTKRSEQFESTLNRTLLQRKRITENQNSLERWSVEVKYFTIIQEQLIVLVSGKFCYLQAGVQR
jgi:hypothetical protein